MSHYLEAIIAKPANWSNAQGRIVAAIEETVKEFEREFKKTTRTWKGKPKWVIRIRVAYNRIMGECFTLSDIYRFVSGGTRVRYATMTPDFIAKTVPKWVGSRPGRGGLLFVNKKRPRPGIKGRQWPQTIGKQQFPYFQRRMTLVMQRVAAESGHAARR